MKRVLLGVFSALFAIALAPTARAAGDQLRFTQGPGGAVSVMLTGFADPCGGFNHFPMGTPSVALAGSEYDVTSTFVILDPPPCPHSPFPYSATAALGTVADGRYSVVWTIGTVVARGEFEVDAGVLVAASAVPTLSLSGVAVLAILITLIAFACMRGPPGARVRRD